MSETPFPGAGGSDLHRQLRALVDQVGADVIGDPHTFRAALDDFLDERVATSGELNLLVDAVRLGALEPVVGVLTTARPPSKLNGKDGRAGHVAIRPLSDEELTRLQALELLAIFASGKGNSPPVWPVRPCLSSCLCSR